MKRVAAKGFALPEKTDAWTPIASNPRPSKTPHSSQLNLWES